MADQQSLMTTIDRPIDEGVCRLRGVWIEAERARDA